MIRKITFLALLATSFANAQFIENFDASTSLPTGWRAINGGDTNTWSVVNFTTGNLTANSGTNAVSIMFGATAHNDYLVTPSFVVTAGVSDYLTFYGRSRDASYPETIAVKISTTGGTTAASFTQTLINSVAPPSGAAFYKYTADLSAYVGQTINIGFLSTTTDKFYFDIDDVSVGAAPACADMLTPTATNITNTSATVNWLATSGTYQLSYGLEGVAAGSGTLVNDLTVLQHDLTNLSPNTVYDMYVRSVCGTNYGIWSSALKLATKCNPINQFPYFEGFEGNNDYRNPDCWKNESLFSDIKWIVNDADGDADYGGVIPAEGNYMMQYTLDNGDPYQARLVTNRFDFTGYTNASLTFKYINKIWGSDINDLQVFYKTSENGSWVALSELITDAHNDWTSLTLPLPNTTSDYYLSFLSTNDYGYGTYLDDISISATLSDATFETAALKMYPNPVQNTLYISNTAAITGVQVYNMLGQVVLNKATNGTDVSVDMSALSSGNYMVKVQTAEGVKTSKVIKK